MAKLETQADVSKHSATEMRVSKWGNSLAIRIPSTLARQAGLDCGSAVTLSATDEGFNVRKCKRQPTLEELLSLVTEENRHDIADWGRPRGKEVW